MSQHLRNEDLGVVLFGEYHMLTSAFGFIMWNNHALDNKSRLRSHLKGSILIREGENNNYDNNSNYIDVYVGYICPTCIVG